MKIIDEAGNKFEVVLYRDGNLVSRRVSDGVVVGAMGTTEPHTPPPAPSPGPVPSNHPNPIQGVLRVVGETFDGAHFADDVREILPVGLTWFGALEQRRSDPEAFKRTLNAVVDAGYHFARVLFAVASEPNGYWSGHEVLPSWPDYDEQVIGLGRDFDAAGMQIFVSSGGLYDVFGGDLDATTQWSARIGALLKQSGVRVAFVDVNEAWQNWVTDSEPAPSDIDRYVTEPFASTYGRNFIALRSAPPEGEVAEAFDRWAGPKCIQKHGHRGHYPQDHTSAVRHARGIYYDERGDVEIPTKRLGIESEPVGPGASVNTLDGKEALALLAVANFMGGFAHVYHSARGVRRWEGPIEQQPGFLSAPFVVSYLPTDFHSAFNLIMHGGWSESPLTDGEGFPGENRVDTVVAEDGRRFVTLAYGEDGHTRLRAQRAVRFNLITPDTGESHPFTLQSGETLDVDYTAGRVIVGELI
jgi:hypothetical protein